MAEPSHSPQAYWFSRCHQAERERDEAREEVVILARSRERLEARLAKVPALVEALSLIAIDLAVNEVGNVAMNSLRRQKIAREALAAWEQE